MQYLLLIYDDEAKMAQKSPAEMGAFMADYGSFTQSIIATGAFKAGDALQPVHSATSVRVRDGQTLLTDGSFAETREQLGGYYLVEAAGLDAAVEIASRIPSARTGTIEVRPVQVYPG